MTSFSISLAHSPCIHMCLPLNADRCKPGSASFYRCPGGTGFPLNLASVCLLYRQFHVLRVQLMCVCMCMCVCPRCFMRAVQLRGVKQNVLTSLGSPLFRERGKMVTGGRTWRHASGCAWAPNGENFFFRAFFARVLLNPQSSMPRRRDH